MSLGLVAIVALAVAVASVVAQNLGPLPRIKAGAGGLAPPEVRLTCPPGEARAFYAALSPEGRAAYLGPQRRLDTVFPVALAVFLASLLVLWFPAPWGVLLAGLPVAAMVADLRENARIAGLLRKAPEDLSDAELVAVGRIITVKFVLLGCAFLAMLIGLLVFLVGP